MHTLENIGTIVVTAALLATGSLGHSSSPPTNRFRSLAVVPQEAPRGYIEVSSLGVTELTPEGGLAIPTMHVKLAITNVQDVAPWAIDVENVRLMLPAVVRAGPLVASSDVGTLPVAVIGNGETRVFDLFFALAETMVRDDLVAGFEVRWRVTTPARMVEGTAAFGREAGSSTVSDPTFLTRRGRRWWFDPSYPWQQYYHRPGYAVPRPPRTAAVTGAPHGHRLVLD